MVENDKKETCMKKIVIDARESGTSTGRYVDKLIENLAELSIPYKVMVLTKNRRVDYIKKIAPKFEVLVADYKEFTFAEQIGLLRRIKHLNADLVHFGMIQQPVLYRGKTVTTIHDLTTARFRNPAKNWLVFTLKQMVYKRVIKIVAKKSTAIITPTDFTKDDLARFADINNRKITATYEAADRISDKSEALENISEADQFIMYVGRPQPHKNLDRLVQAFIKLKEKHPGLKLVLAGKKDRLYRRSEKYAKSHGASGIIFTDFVSEGQLKWLYEHANAYVFPSLSEGFGLPGLEAMMHGAPVVSSNSTCLPEVYGDAAHYFNPLDVNDMAEKIDEVLTNEKLRKELIEKGKSQVKKYSWKRMAEQTLEVYKKVLDN
jgi:glycosyltransferase involved in cell wall biosynthesis